MVWWAIARFGDVRVTAYVLCTVVWVPQRVLQSIVLAWRNTVFRVTAQRRNGFQNTLMSFCNGYKYMIINPFWRIRPSPVKHTVRDKKIINCRVRCTFTITKKKEKKKKDTYMSMFGLKYFTAHLRMSLPWLVLRASGTEYMYLLVLCLQRTGNSAD